MPQTKKIVIEVVPRKKPQKTTRRLIKYIIPVGLAIIISAVLLKR